MAFIEKGVWLGDISVIIDLTAYRLIGVLPYFRPTNHLFDGTISVCVYLIPVCLLCLAWCVSGVVVVVVVRGTSSACIQPRGVVRTVFTARLTPGNPRVVALSKKRVHLVVRWSFSSCGYPWWAQEEVKGGYDYWPRRCL